MRTTHLDTTTDPQRLGDRTACGRPISGRWNPTTRPVRPEDTTLRTSGPHAPTCPECAQSR